MSLSRASFEHLLANSNAVVHHARPEIEATVVRRSAIWLAPECSRRSSGPPSTARQKILACHPAEGAFFTINLMKELSRAAPSWHANKL